MSKDKLTLYEIEGQMLRLFDLLLTGEEEDLTLFEEQFPKVEIQLQEKMLSSRHMVKKWDGFVKDIDEEIKRLKEYKEQVENAKSRVMGRIRGILEKLEDGKFVDSSLGFGFRLQKNSQPKVDIQDLDKLEEYNPDLVRVTVERVGSRTKVLELYKSTGEIPDGVEITEGKHVRVI